MRSELNSAIKMLSLVSIITIYCTYGGLYCVTTVMWPASTVPTPEQWQRQVLRGQKEALRSSACRADSGGITSSSGGGIGGGSSGGGQSVHRHAKVLVTRLRERNAHCLEGEAADGRERLSSHTHSGDMQATGLHTVGLYTDEGGWRTGQELSFLLRVNGDVRINQWGCCLVGF